MKFRTARFEFTDGEASVLVTFDGDEVSVWRKGKVKRLRNKPARWGGRPYKPRVADCLRAIADTEPSKRVPPKPLAVVG